MIKTVGNMSMGERGIVVGNFHQEVPYKGRFVIKSNSGLFVVATGQNLLEVNNWQVEIKPEDVC